MHDIRSRLLRCQHQTSSPPIDKSNDNDDNSRKGENINNKAKRILVVDDEPSICLFFKICLEINGFIVDAFESPINAISHIKNNMRAIIAAEEEHGGADSNNNYYYDLLIIDIKMPEMNGFEFYEHIENIFIKELRQKKIPRACFLTALDVIIEEEYAKRSFTWKAKPAFVRKPISAIALSKLASQLTATTSAGKNNSSQSSSTTTLLLSETRQMEEAPSCRYCGASMDDKAKFLFARKESIDNKVYFCNNPQCSGSNSVSSSSSTGYAF